MGSEGKSAGTTLAFRFGTALHWGIIFYAAGSLQEFAVGGQSSYSRKLGLSKSPRFVSTSGADRDGPWFFTQTQR